MFESKRQETCALMAEKTEVCGAYCGKSATPAENYLSVPRFPHGPHCQCGGGGHHDTEKACHLGNVGLKHSVEFQGP